MSEIVLLNDEELLVKHKKERKDLQAQIQSLKKSCAKGDKKKKKEITEQITLLEKNLDEKQNQELEQLKGLDNSDKDKDNEVTTPEEEQNSEESESAEMKETTRVSKAQKRRIKKAVENKERLELIRAQELENRKGPRIIEMDKIKQFLQELGLSIYSIPADGNCLYCSVNHQLKTTGREEYSVSELRKITADYMRSHKDDILPFMSNEFDGDEEFTEEQYEKYCTKVANTTEWGGQIEILALSSALKCPIKIIQATASPMTQGEDFDGPPLILTYHRHLYRLGEHYNSTRPVPTDV